MSRAPSRPPLYVRLLNRVLERLHRSDAESFSDLRLVGTVLERECMKFGLVRLAEADPRTFRRFRAQFDVLNEILESGWSERRADIVVRAGDRPTYVAAEISWVATAAAACTRFEGRTGEEKLTYRLANRAWLRTALLCAEFETDPPAWRSWAHETAEEMTRALHRPRPSRLRRMETIYRLILNYVRELEHRESLH